MGRHIDTNQEEIDISWPQKGHGNNLKIEYFLVDAEQSRVAQFIHIVLEDATKGTWYASVSGFSQEVLGEEWSRATRENKDVRLINLMRERAPF